MSASALRCCVLQLFRYQAPPPHRQFVRQERVRLKLRKETYEDCVLLLFTDVLLLVQPNSKVESLVLLLYSSHSSSHRANQR